VTRDELIVRAELGNLAILDHGDAVGVADRARRCAMISAVRPSQSRRNAVWMRRSVLTSTAEVASRVRAS